MEGASNEQDPEKKKELEEFLKSQELLGGDTMVKKSIEAYKKSIEEKLEYIPEEMINILMDNKAFIQKIEKELAATESKEEAAIFIDLQIKLFSENPNDLENNLKIFEGALAEYKKRGDVYIDALLTDYLQKEVYRYKDLAEKIKVIIDFLEDKRTKYL